MKLGGSEILEIVRRVLAESGSSISVEKSPLSSVSEGREVLVLELRGKEFSEIAKDFGGGEKMLLRWSLPDAQEDSCRVRDIITGNLYTAGCVFRRKEFAQRTPGSPAPLSLAPNLKAEGAVVESSWLRDVKFKWRKFAERVKAAGDFCSLDDFVRLEAGLNAVFTSSEARRLAGFSEEVISEESNPLLEIENSRQVLIDWPARTLGRLRIPHESHKNLLCPFETPESQRTGLQLNLTAGSVVRDGTIIPGRTPEMLSIAVGLIPYPNHTDGPRLMMGGKNMKQAETGISGAEAPLVPGRYEGEYIRDIPALNAHKKGRRFFPYLGLNALTVIMPFGGYTYEDGIVISESLAERLCIPEGHYRYSQIFDVVLRSSDVESLGVKDIQREGLPGIFGTLENRKYIYGDSLPEPRITFFSRDSKALTWREKYLHHSPGILESVKIKCVVKSGEGSSRRNDKRCNVELVVTWSFRVRREMGLGDKLTGRNGNKGVVTRILPDSEMPQIHFADEVRPAELIISPVSVMGRKNLGQVWEMTHSLLIQKGGEKLREFLESQDFDINNEPLDELPEFSSRLGEFLAETGCDESGLFRVTCTGFPETRAFAGWQYFCRLHHHAWKKLQARGSDAPCSSLTGQPLQCGALTGQRMGEMENWSLLSHGAGRVLSGMRRKFTGEFTKTLELFRKVLRSLGIVVSEKDSGLEFRARNEHDDSRLSRKNLRWEMYALGTVEQKAFCAMIYANDEETGKSFTCRELAEEIRDKLKDKTLAKQIDALIQSECFFNPDGSLHVEPDVVDAFGLRDSLLAFCMFGSYVSGAEALLNYRDGLIKILSGKEGLLRKYLSGRRYDHSGRAVIVPEPSLCPHEVYLPGAMLTEILEGYDPEYMSRFPVSLPEVRRLFNDYADCREESHLAAEVIDQFLRSDSGELWCFLIRQPSLHRHSVLAFRVRCWEFPVIGIPPLVTPGFNADFDGDTMAVFLPETARDLREFSIVSSPGLVGTGKSAFADNKDIALGRLGFSEHLKTLLKEISSLSFEERSRALQTLQAQTMRDSTGAATLSPLEFVNVCRTHELSEDFRGLKVMLDSGAAGSMKDIAAMTDSIGAVSMMRDADGLSIDDKKSFETRRLSGNFWEGLSDEELFAYSYPSRFSMAQKKLSVADAGYLSRQLAERLYEFTVSIPDCGTADGLEVAYIDGRLLVCGQEIPESEAERVLWGRVIAGGSECLDSQGVCVTLERLKAGERVFVRSPLTCREREDGHVCAKCYGADLASKPYDSPVPVSEGFAAGLTAAQAIGERGTQLAMKKFHDVAGEKTEEVSVAQVRKILLSDDVSLEKIITEILAHSQSMKQALIHFETAAAFTGRHDGAFLSELEEGNVSRVLRRAEKSPERDDLSSIKSRLLWEGENKNGE